MTLKSQVVAARESQPLPGPLEDHIKGHMINAKD